MIGPYLILIFLLLVLTSLYLTIRSMQDVTGVPGFTTRRRLSGVIVFTTSGIRHYRSV